MPVRFCIITKSLACVFLRLSAKAKKEGCLLRGSLPIIKFGLSDVLCIKTEMHIQFVGLEDV